MNPTTNSTCAASILMSSINSVDCLSRIRLMWFVQLLLHVYNKLMMASSDRIVFFYSIFSMQMKCTTSTTSWSLSSSYLLFIWSSEGKNTQYEYCMHFVRHLRTDTINNSNNINEQKLSQRNFLYIFRLIAFLFTFAFDVWAEIITHNYEHNIE